MLKLKHITKDYVTKQQTIHVLKDLTLNFRPCEFVTILGQSGCGKTTLLNIVGGLDRYTDGDIVINGRSTKDFDDRDWDRYRNKQIGFVFQSYNLIPHLNVLHNVELALTLAGKSKEEREARAMEVLKKVGLEDQALKKPNQLSGGQMQRVAIARALVNNPAIILADEPTGALDTESGTMVMELLKEVAADRLVILVSHNAELAQNYSTRTVQLVDGKIINDTNPFFEEGDEDEEYVEAVTPDMAGKKTVRQRIKKSYKQIVKERKEDRKVSMNGATTIGLSARNLYSKKWRTFLTSFAGSIGIIGISLVLALSAGVNTYISATEESALSIYPITISKEGASITEIAKLLTTPSKSPKYPKATDVLIKKVAGNFFDTFKTGDLIFENDLPEIKEFFDEYFEGHPEDGYVSYKYSSQINVYRQVPLYEDGEFKYKSANLGSAESPSYTYYNGLTDEHGDAYDIPYTKVSPFYDSLNTLTGQLASSFNVKEIIDANFGQYLEMFYVFNELINNQALLEQQYDLVGDGSRWPYAANEQGYLDENGKEVYECVIQVNSSNEIDDYMLFAAGLMHPDQVGGMLLGTKADQDTFYARQYSVEELLGVSFAVLSDSDYYHKEDADDELWKSDLSGAGYKTKSDMEFVNSQSGITLKVVGVVRPKKNADATAIQGVIGYSHALTEAVIDRCTAANTISVNPDTKAYDVDDLEELCKSSIVVDQLTNCYTDSSRTTKITKFKKDFSIFNTSDAANPVWYNVITDEEIVFNEDITNIFDFVKAKMGYANVSDPDSINVYASSFIGKDNILKMFDDYQNNNPNNPNKKGIKYTDMLSILMTYIKQLTNAMITALIAFSAISLIVSSIMISIITYTSVLERRKEIGVLRSIGARKMDISNLFISESSIIGIISGVLGIAFGYLLTYIANLIIFQELEIPRLLSLSWYYAIGLIVISFLLSLIAGIIPASIAAEKDPVEALRTE